MGWGWMGRGVWGGGGRSGSLSPVEIIIAGANGRRQITRALAVPLPQKKNNPEFRLFPGTVHEDLHAGKTEMKMRQQEPAKRHS